MALAYVARSSHTHLNCDCNCDLQLDRRPILLSMLLITKFEKKSKNRFPYSPVQQPPPKTSVQEGKAWPYYRPGCVRVRARSGDSGSGDSRGGDGGCGDDGSGDEAESRRQEGAKCEVATVGVAAVTVAMEVSVGVTVKWQ